MPDNKSPVERIKKFARFLWRHFFTVADISLSINILIYDNLLWKNALISLSIAVTIDWAKQFIKLTPNSKRAQFCNEMGDSPIHIRQPWNSSIIGTPTNLMNIGHKHYD